MGGTMINDTLCKEAALTVRSFWYLCPSFLIFFASNAGIIFIFAALRDFQFKQAYHVNTKIIISLNMASNLIFSIATSGNYGWLIINTMIATNDCDLLFRTPNCSLLRQTFFFTSMLNTLSHIALIIERGYATHKLKNYEGVGNTFGIYLAAGCVLGSMIMIMWVTWNEDPNEMLTNCYAFSSCPSISNQTYSMFRVQLALEIITYLACKCLVFITNRRSAHNTASTYELCDRYETVTTNVFVNDISPLYSTSSLIVAAYFVFSHILFRFRPDMTLPHYKQMASWIFILPYHAFISMIYYNKFFKNQAEGRRRRLEETVSLSMKRENQYNFELGESWSHGGSPKSPKKSYISMA